MISAGGLPVHLVHDAAELARAVDACRARERVALDTEFMRTRTFHAKAALFQLCDGDTCYLVDPLVIEDLSPLAALLEDARVTKLMHSCGEDLEVCAHRLGAVPAPLVDTQVLAAFVGHGLSVGYQRLVGNELGIELEKSETRTDWLQRPLSVAQLRYAAEDVAFLPRLHECLEARLAAQAWRMQWAAEECAAIVPRFRARMRSSDPAAIGGAWRLRPRALAALAGLHAWREREARERDLPRSWVVPDAALLRIAETGATSDATLAAIDELPESSRRRHGRALLAAVAAAAAMPEEDLPPVLPAPPGPAETRRVKALREVVQQRAEALGIAPEMLARRRELEELVRSTGGSDREERQSLALLEGWRRVAIGEELQRLVEAMP